MDIAELLEELNIPARRTGEHHHAREGWIQTDCPWCSPNAEAFRLGFNLYGNYCNCWVCGPCNLWDTLAALSDLPLSKFRTAFQKLERNEVTGTKIEHQGKLVLPKRLGPLKPAHKRYLRKRGFKPKEIERLWKIQGIDHLGGHLAWRIFIPVYYHNAVVSWTTRSISNEGIRYLSSKKQESAIPRSEILYGEDFARWAIIVNEGPLDAWAIGPGAVATLGVGYSSSQLARMIKYPIRAVCFDNNPDAQRRARQLVDSLSHYPGKTYNVVLDAEDAASASKKEIRKLRKAIL